MTIPIALFLMLFVPGALICAAFFLMALKLYKSKGGEEAGFKTLALAQELDRSLEKMESRLANLEDIIIGPGRDNPEPKN
jgi:hypothetical protein